MPGRTTRRPIRLAAAAVLLSLLIVASPVAAFAAAGVPQSVDLTLIGAGQVSGILLVTGKLAPNVPLPAKLDLGVPPGVKIGWVGEILGGPSSKDPNDKYSVTPGSSYDLVSFTLTRGRTGQAEAGQLTGFTTNGNATDAKFSWVAPYALSTVNLSIQFPGPAKVTGGTPGGKSFQSGTGHDYRLTIHDVKKGQNVQFNLSYAGGATTSAAPLPISSPGGPSNGLIRILIILLAIVIFFLLVYLGLRYVASSSPNADADADTAKGKRK
jgi:hypothetical protein